MGVPLEMIEIGPNISYNAHEANCYQVANGCYKTS